MPGLREESPLQPYAFRLDPFYDAQGFPVYRDSVRTALHYGPRFINNVLPHVRENIADHYDNNHYASAGFYSLADGGVLMLADGNCNEKPGENETKLCAERAIMLRARIIEWLGIYAVESADVFLTTGKNQPDTQSGKQTQAIANCGVCRTAGEKDPFVHAATVTVTIDENKPVREVQSWEELIAWHQDSLGARAPKGITDPGLYLWRQALRAYDTIVPPKDASYIPIEERLELMQHLLGSRSVHEIVQQVKEARELQADNNRSVDLVHA